MRGFISLDFINYKLYREIKCFSDTHKSYTEKTIIEEQEVINFEQNNEDVAIKVNFSFKGQPETKISKMPTCHGKLIHCFYFIFVSVKIKGFCVL